jgi:uncharacterized protein YndB with AHSA1/START domain
MSNATFTVNRKEMKVVVERTFHAQPARVFKAVTDLESVPHWWGPRRFKTTVDKMDVRKGGSWRYIVHTEDGTQFAFHGVYREVSAPKRLSYTFNVEGASGDNETIETVTFESVGDETRMVQTVEYKNHDDLDQVVSSGMEGRVIEAWNRLAEIVES